MTFREKMKRIFRHSSVGSHGHKAEGNNKPHQGTQTRPATGGPGANGGPAAVGKAGPPPPKPAPGTAQSRFVGAKARTPKLDRDGNPKIELYKAHQVPPSKFRGPFDPTHMKNMADYTIPQGRNDRPLSMMSDLSPTHSKEPAPWDIVVGPAGEQVPPERRNDDDDDDDDDDGLDPAAPCQSSSSSSGDRAPDRSSETAHYDGDSRSSHTLVQPPSNDPGHKAESQHFEKIHFTEPYYPSNDVVLPADTPAPPPATGRSRPALTAINVRA